MKTLDTSQRLYGLKLFMVLSAMLMFAACSDKGQAQQQRSLTEFKMYVKEHKEAADKYAEEKWEDIDKEYQEKKADLDRQAEHMDKEMKQSYVNAVADWEEFKSDMEAKRESKHQEKQVDKLKETFVPEYVKTDLSNTTGKNIVMVYKRFFEVIEKNKDVYTKEEWTIANNYWNDLNAIREKLEERNAISKEDKREINDIRIKYGATKALNKPFAEGAKQ